MKKNGETALDLLQDDEVRAALERRRSILRQRLADLQVDRMMPGFQPAPEFLEAEETLVKALKEIARRLDGASKALRTEAVVE